MFVFQRIVMSFLVACLFCSIPFDSNARSSIQLAYALWPFGMLERFSFENRGVMNIKTFAFFFAHIYKKNFI